MQRAWEHNVRFAAEEPTKLASLFGGKETSSTGFGLGFDRTWRSWDRREANVARLLVYTPMSKMEAVRIAEKRCAG